MRDHVGLPIVVFKGLFDRGTEDPCPSDHFVECSNLQFDQNECETRDGVTNSLDVNMPLRIHLYKRVGEADRFIILAAGGLFYDSHDMDSAILSVPTATDFSMFNFFGRAYITPHNGIKGIAGEFVYVYNGEGPGTVRQALGAAPSGTLVAAQSAMSGNVEEGTHIYAVSYETASGYLTKPGPALFATQIATGEFKVDLSSIPIGPTGTTKRHILATKFIEEYDGNQLGYEFFFVPDGVLEDNTSTTITVNFFDADLFSSADYLFDQLESLDACLGITQYMSRMVTWGGPDDYVVRVSKSGEPESFDALDGFLTVDPTDTGSVRCCTEFRNSLYMMKSSRTHVTVDPQNDTNAGLWEVVSIDRGVGTEVFGVAAILDTKGTNIDRYIITDRSGILLFDGLYQRPELTWKIRDWWQGINKDAFHKIQIFNDPIKQRLYVAVPYGVATTNNVMLFGDYSEGLDANSIKWSPWTFPFATTSILIDTDADNETFLRIASVEDDIYDVTPGLHNDDGTAIDSYARTALISASPTGELCHVAGIRLRVFGSGSLELSLYGEDSVDIETMYPITLATSPGEEKVSLASFVGERFSLKFRTHLFNEWFRINRIVLFTRVLWTSAPYAE